MTGTEREMPERAETIGSGFLFDGYGKSNEETIRA